MENVVNINIRKLSNGSYIATSNNFTGMEAKGSTITDALEAVKNLIKQAITKK